MSKIRIKFSTLAFVLLLALSGASFGFLLGRSQQLANTSEDTEQLHTVSTSLTTGGALIARAVSGIRYLLIQ